MVSFVTPAVGGATGGTGRQAALSQLHCGWDYRDRRKDKRQTTNADRCVILYSEPGGTPLYEDTGVLEARLQKDGSVHFRDRRNGELVCVDYGDRVVFYHHQDEMNWWIS